MKLPQMVGAAPFETTLGMLERGRGAGWTQAAASKNGQELLAACVRRETRWDRQVENRSDYYATLALHLDVPVAVLVSQPIDGEEWILDEVLTAMAARGSAEASEFLATSKREESLAWQAGPDSRPEGTSRQLPQADQPIDVLLAESTGPFRKAVVHRLRITKDPAEVGALREASQDRTHPGWRLALRVLSLRGDTTPLGVVEEVLERNESGATRAAAFQYVWMLPMEISLPLARTWIAFSDGRGSVAGEVMSGAAELEDTSAIRAALGDADDYYTICSLVEALGRLPAAGPFPELEVVYEQSAYSYARARAVKAMAATDPEFGGKWATECLWDCEDLTRIAGARFAPMEGVVISRLRELASDPLECDEVRSAAEQRL